MFSYRSPFRLLEISPADCTIQSLQLIRKQLLAEFELQQRDTIEWNGVTLDRQQALDLVEELLQQDRFLFHRRVYENKLLLALLEDDDPAYLFHAADDTFERSFVSSCEPWLLLSFGKLAVSAFERADVELLRHIQQSHPLVTYAIRARCLDKLGLSLRERVKYLKKLKHLFKWNPAAAKTQFSLDILLIGNGFLTELPAELDKEREEYIGEVTELLWYIPDKVIDSESKLVMLELLAATSGSNRVKGLIKKLQGHLAFAAIETPAFSRATGILFFLPLIFIFTWMVIVRLTHHFALFSETEKNTLTLSSRFFFWTYTGIILVFALRHAYRSIYTEKAYWFYILILMNVIALPIYWLAFMRNLRDKTSTYIMIGAGLLLFALMMYSSGGSHSGR